MPTISSFYGILIQMFWDDHAPAHFHVIYAEYNALTDIKTFEVIERSYPSQSTGFSIGVGIRASKRIT